MTRGTRGDRSGRAKSVDTQTFVCSFCNISISGEVSLIQHVQGKKHQTAARGRPLQLEPNRSGTIPQLSASANEEIYGGSYSRGSRPVPSHSNAPVSAYSNKPPSFRDGGWKSKMTEIDNQTFVCAFCNISISGEVSLIQHVQGKRHQTAARGRSLELKKNSSGIIPKLSESAKRAIDGKGASRSCGFNGSSSVGKKPAEISKALNLSRASQDLLYQALDLDPSDDVDTSTMASTRNGSFSSSYSRPEAVRQQRAATVPERARGNASLQSVREALPAFEHRDEILRAIDRNSVIIVEGETGCGKTTQVGQFIVEHAAMLGQPCSVVCTQPRRISAISVAERVAEERGEWLGDSVGYSVRLENKTGPKTCLLFCTTGILLRRLESDPDLVGATHIVVDEVHERGVESDFLLLALRDLSRRRQDLKIILMSATMDKDLFGRYFGGAPSITVPGRTFPVEDFFLEDALQATGHTINSSAEWAVGKAKGKGKGKGGDSGDREELDAPKREDLTSHSVWNRYRGYGPRVQQALCGLEQDLVNYELIVDLLRGSTLDNLSKEYSESRPTGVLIFMSGAKEIETLQDAVRRLDQYNVEPARSWVLPLHGGLPTADQKKVFVRPPEGVRKIVIATNVAETAVTINDIGYVIDTCRMKEMRYDAIRCMSSLEDTVVSRTNARQRRGRAGRVAPGICVHLGLTRYRHDHLIDDHQPPEVQRTPLEQLILRIHAVGLHLRDPSGKANAICARLIEPPNPAFVAKAVDQLVRLGALELQAYTDKESLTTLGDHLAHLPLEARLGKLVLYGAAFGPAATNAALTVAAALTSRNPFVAPLEHREEANKTKRKFADKVVGGPVGPSDHLAVLEAYNEWDKLPMQGEARYNFCQENYLSIKTLQGMSELKRSLLEMLSEAGFVKRHLRAKDLLWMGRRENSDGVLLALGHRADSEPCPPALVAALLCAALFPQVAKATLPQLQGKKPASEGQAKPKLIIRDAETAEEVRVKMHPGSVSAQEVTLSSPYIAYQELVKTTMLYVRDVTPVPPLALALFSGSLKKVSRSSTRDVVVLGIDGWIELPVKAALERPLLEARKRLDALLANWVGRRKGEEVASQDDAGAVLLKIIVQLLSIQEKVEPARAEQQQKQQKTGKFKAAKSAVQKLAARRNGAGSSAGNASQGGGGWLGSLKRRAAFSSFGAAAKRRR